MGYSMALIIGRKEIPIPVLPDKLEVSSAGKNEKVEVLELGEVLVLRQKALRLVGWKSFFPARDEPYVTGPCPDPTEAVQAIQRARDAEKPLRLLLLGADLDINMRVGVEDFSYDERGGEPGDLYYSIKLSEWKDYAPRRVIMPTVAVRAAYVQDSPRGGEPPKARTHTVVRGDTLWAIAQKHYGDGNRYPELYRRNQAVMDARNKGTGYPKYTIYAGQVLNLD